MAHRLRLLIADDHEAVRDGLRSLFATTSDVSVVGELGNAETLPGHVRVLGPDVVLLDLAMPRAGGLAALRRLRQAGVSVPVVILTRFRTPSVVRDALAAGASGYVLKQSPFAEVQQALTAVSTGRRYVDRSLLALLDRDNDPARPFRTSARELDVLRQSALGHSQREIAEHLALSVKSVEAHKTHAMRKLRLPDRRALVRYAVIQGWFSDL